MRINKFLASAGLGSRRKVEELVVSGKIKVNSVIITNLATEIGVDDIVEYEGKRIMPASNRVYIMLNKPKCYITSLSDEKDRRIVTDLLKGCNEKVFPVGRLDYNTQGLLLLTNDGDWANSIIHPSSHINKTYEVHTKYVLKDKQLNQIRNGIVIDGRRTLPAKIVYVGSCEDKHIYHLTIFEGRNREIRKMFEILGLKIYALKRISIGSLELADLQEGKYRYLSKSEINKVFE